PPGRQPGLGYGDGVPHRWSDRRADAHRVGSESPDADMCGVHSTRPMNPFLTCPAAAFGRDVCRLGLASRIGATLTADDVLHAIDHGVNFLNWPGEADEPGGPDAVSEAVADFGGRRDDVVICVQFGARTASDAAAELRSVLQTLQSDYVDVVTFYYVEQES